MSMEAIKAIVLSEMGMVEEDLTDEQRIALAIDITLRLLGICVEAHSE